jgi:hypothetical protein
MTEEDQQSLRDKLDSESKDAKIKDLQTKQNKLEQELKEIRDKKTEAPKEYFGSPELEHEVNSARKEALQLRSQVIALQRELNAERAFISARLPEEKDLMLIEKTDLIRILSNETNLEKAIEEMGPRRPLGQRLLRPLAGVLAVVLIGFFIFEVFQHLTFFEALFATTQAKIEAIVLAAIILLAGFFIFTRKDRPKLGT